MTAAWVRAAVTAVAAALSLGAALPAAGGGGAAGRVTWHGEGVSGARVFAYVRFDGPAASAPAAVSAPTDDDGSFRLDLPPGRWFLVARRAPSGGVGGPVRVGGLFAFHGSNPVAITAGSYSDVHFPLVEKTAEATVLEGADPGAGSISGVALLDGKPLEGVQVRLYLDAGDGFRGMGYALAPPTSPDGSFRFDLLPESDYWVVARRRGRGGAGPLAPGDSFGYFVDNPVQVRAGRETSIRLSLVQKAERGGAGAVTDGGTATVISGRVRDAAGDAVPGTYVFAYREKLMSHKRPAAISREVDAEGRYRLYLPAGGTWYLGARSAYGDAPGIGEWYGRWDGAPDHSVRIGTGARLDAVDITVEKILQ